MRKLNELPNIGNKNKKRLGRGIGSGKGKTSGRGHKGQKARSGVAIKGFEGGQTPIYMRLPQRGFSNIFRKHYKILTTDSILNMFISGTLDPKKTVTKSELIDKKIIKKNEDIKIVMGKKEVDIKFEIEADKASEKAKQYLKK